MYSVTVPLVVEAGVEPNPHCKVFIYGTKRPCGLKRGSLEALVMLKSKTNFVMVCHTRDSIRGVLFSMFLISFVLFFQAVCRCHRKCQSGQGKLAEIAFKLYFISYRTREKLQLTVEIRT